MSSPFDIRVPVSRLRVEDDTDLSSLIPGFMVYLKDRYVELLIANLKHRKRVGRQESEYRKKLSSYLLENGISSIPTVTGGLLTTNLQIRRGRSYYYIELDKRAMIAPKFSLEKYLRLLEFGRRGLSPRAVFLPTKRNIEACIPTIWYEYYDKIGGMDRDRYRDLRQSSLRISEGRLRSRSVRAYEHRNKADIKGRRGLS